jgi:hypothetical protein
MIVYIYDLKAEERKKYNRLKRNFYYSLNKNKEIFKRRTKSVIIIEDKDEAKIDKFFTQWAGLVEVYKIRTNSIEQVAGTEKIN